VLSRVIPGLPPQPGDADYHIIERPDRTLPGFTTYVEGLLNLALDRGLNITFRARVNGVESGQVRKHMCTLSCMSDPEHLLGPVFARDSMLR
jgi:hypothetical protein